MTEASTKDLLVSLQKGAKELITAHLKTRAVSISSHEGKRTGNAYQAVQLGDEKLRGFRASDRNVFAGLDLNGRTVLDLGCNLGEITREARRAGAAAAYGIEYDDFFVQMARYVAAYNGISGVFFQQGDLTKAETYRGTYDVIVALSVFTYIKDSIAQLAAMANEFVVIETHAVKENWQKLYLAPLKQHFQHVALVGISDHQAQGSTDRRYLLFCSHRPLDGVIAARARELATSTSVPFVDLSASSILHFDRLLQELGLPRETALEELVAAARRQAEGTTPEQVCEQVEKTGLVQSGLYWCVFLKGYEEYLAERSVPPTNSYYTLLRELTDRGLYDASFRELFANGNAASNRLALRYGVFDSLRRSIDGSELDPITMFDLVTPRRLGTNPTYRLCVGSHAKEMCPLALDGHHRLFAAYLMRATRIRAVPVWYEDIPQATALERKGLPLESVAWEDVYEFAPHLSTVANIATGS